MTIYPGWGGIGLSPDTAAIDARQALRISVVNFIWRVHWAMPGEPIKYLDEIEGKRRIGIALAHQAAVAVSVVNVAGYRTAPDQGLQVQPGLARVMLAPFWRIYRPEPNQRDSSRKSKREAVAIGEGMNGAGEHIARADGGEWRGMTNTQRAKF